MTGWDAQPPDRLGRYTLLGKLARGGMAELFLAKSEGIEGFEKVVVLKRILPSFAEDEEFIELFLSEARLAAQLDHANIVHVHDIGREGANFFFTMEYLHGHDVRRLLNEARSRDHQLPLPFVLTIVAGAAAGLHHAHQQVDFRGRPLGIVHRDVSPSNIIVTDSGNVKVVDFGIAKAAALSRASRASSLKGKVAYMSPEQCKGGTVDRRSDVFALGLVMQEMLTNRPVFGHLTHVEALHAVASGKVVPVEEHWPECPEDLRAILGRALQPDPDERYPSALHFHRELERFAHEHRIMLSSPELAAFLEAVFGTKRLPWLEDEDDFSDPEPASAASATVDKRRDAGAAGDTRIATMLAPEVMFASPESSEPAEAHAPGANETLVGRGSETSIRMEPVPAPSARRRWPWAAAGAAAVLGVMAVWGSGVSRSPASDTAAAAPLSRPAAVSQAREVPSAEPPPPEAHAKVAEAPPKPDAPLDIDLEEPSAAVPDPPVSAVVSPTPKAEPTRRPRPPRKAKTTSKPARRPDPKPEPKAKPTDPNALLPY